MLFSYSVVIEVITKFDFDVTCYSFIYHALNSIQALTKRISVRSSYDGSIGLMGSKNVSKYPWMNQISMFS